jgi:hypothetical protein
LQRITCRIFLPKRDGESRLAFVVKTGSEAIRQQSAKTIRLPQEFATKR